MLCPYFIKCESADLFTKWWIELKFYSMFFPGQKCLYINGKIENPLKMLKTEGVGMCLKFRLYPMDKYVDQHCHKLLHIPH